MCYMSTLVYVQNICVAPQVAEAHFSHSVLEQARFAGEENLRRTLQTGDILP